MFFKGIVLAAVVFLFDQASKWYMLTLLGGKENGIEVTPFFNLVIVWNAGISFGMMRGLEYGQYVFSVLAAVIVSVLLYMLVRVRHTAHMIAVGLIVGGAVGNIVDRIRFGAVLDFLDFHLAGHHWPAFNVADSAVFLGTALFCLDMLLVPRKPAES